MAHGFDSFIYDKEGNRIADSLRHLRFDVDPLAPVPGTGGFRMIAGVVSVFTGANLTAKFLIFAWLGFLGSYLFYRAFVTALPNADHHRYALLIFLWPTLLYWPSSIGKDGWMLLTLGIASLGAARILVRRPGGYTLLVAGLLLGSFVRPHVSLMALLAFGVALLIGRREQRAARDHPELGGEDRRARHSDRHRRNRRVTAPRPCSTSTTSVVRRSTRR